MLTLNNQILPNLAELGWFPIWVITDTYEHPPTTTIITLVIYQQMNEWCAKNCQDQWNPQWFRKNLCFWFKNKEDSVLFSFTWL